MEFTEFHSNLNYKFLFILYVIHCIKKCSNVASVKCRTDVKHTLLNAARYHIQKEVLPEIETANIQHLHTIQIKPH